MSPRRNRPRRRASSDGEAAPALDVERAQRFDAVQAWSDGEWLVRAIPGGAATKTYRCPGCAQEIRPGAAHLVAWPVDGRGDEGDRRHWHTPCWRARDRRRPVG